MTRRSAEEWRELVGAWRASGESRQQFASRHEVHPQTLSWWAWRLGSRGEQGVPASAFAEVVVSSEAAVTVPDLVVEVGHVRIRVPRGFDVGDLRRLVGALC